MVAKVGVVSVAPSVPQERLAAPPEVGHSCGHDLPEAFTLDAQTACRGQLAGASRISRAVVLFGQRPRACGCGAQAGG